MTDESAAEPIVIVAGFVLCGLATTMAMLEAGGMPLAGDPGPPTYELPQTTHSVEEFMRGLFGPYGMADQIVSQLPAPLLAIGNNFDARWFAGLGGQAVKLVNPHLLGEIPLGSYRVIWLDRDELERARAWLRYVGLPETGMICHIIQAYFTASRPLARAALLKAGATILDVQHADLFSNQDRRRVVVDRMVDFLDLPLDRGAMVERLAAVEW